VTADNWVGQVHVFDLGLQLAAVLFRDLGANPRLGPAAGYSRSASSVASAIGSLAFPGQQSQVPCAADFDDEAYAALTS
jgi:hypothetical protein